MKRRMDQIIVVDLEATCWDGPTEMRPASAVSDIIEIGIAVLAIKSQKIILSEGIMVKPLRSKISKFCTELTTITDDMLFGAAPLPQVCDYIRSNYAPKYRIWAAWGEFDRVRLEKECRELHADYPFSPRYINVKTMFACQQQLGKEIGLGKAMEMCNMEFEGTQHRGVDDAINTARILKTILWP